MDKQELNKLIESAKQGDADAQYAMAWLYESGDGVPQSDTKAVEWYRRAADQGHVKAQVSLGIAYEEGQGVGQSYEKAVEWYRRAADQGDVGAQICLALAYKDVYSRAGGEKIIKGMRMGEMGLQGGCRGVAGGCGWEGAVSSRVRVVSRCCRPCR